MANYLCEVHPSGADDPDETDNFPDCRVAIEDDGTLNVIADDDTIETTYAPDEWDSVLVEKVIR